MNRKDNGLNKKDAMKEEYNAFLEELSKKYPEVNIEEVILGKFLKKANENKKSEMMEFKAQAESTFGTGHEMSFYEIESGLFSAMLADGRNAMKDIMENIPVEHPVNADKEKMKNHGIEKKT